MNSCARIEPNIAQVGALIGDPSRAAILTVLLHGRSMTAGEIAVAAGVGATAASAHFAKLMQSGLITMIQQGRHRYYRLAGGEIATAIESLAQVAPLPQVFQLPSLSPSARVLRFARSCYDHLAGELAVSVAVALEESGWLVPAEDKSYQIHGASARRWFGKHGIEVDKLRPGRYGVARQCLDWTERRAHLAGPVGSALFRAWCEAGWLKRDATHPRLMHLTSFGRKRLIQELGLKPDDPSKNHASSAFGTYRYHGSVAA